MARKKKLEYSPEIDFSPDITMRLALRLRDLLNEKQFVTGMLGCVADIEDQVSLLKFLEESERLTTDSVARFAFDLFSKRAELNRKRKQHQTGNMCYMRNRLEYESKMAGRN